ncbi:peptidase [Hoeflea sp. E7-10]|uniref:Peptidase n=2 Tax=Hoeflea poritis TaxID=2993659 RepID=A0ABT4VNF0_9HYPH|nr:imelysin family protein [Hoeflea poritis]MDA4846220.1 peptidase [Hoeflea poritis]
MRKIACAAPLALAVVAAAPSAQAEVDGKAVLKTYADIAEANYADSLTTAKALEVAIGALVADPSEATMQGGRDAWKAARIPYQQTEAFRFGNPIVDDWEGRVNAWPLDEGMIDYVDSGYGTESDLNPLYTANIIANQSLKVNGEDVDISAITPAVLSGKLHEAGDVEANVTTGYHAIEFLLWGQDLNGTDAGAGNRPYTDFDPDNCTGGNCARRAEYLAAAANLLVDDLEEMVANWRTDGEARKAVMDGEVNQGVAKILTGMGSLSYGELAGERMKLGLLLHDPEEEHDCFSDNTHISHLYDAIGIRNVYEGSYTRTDGSVVKGPSVSDMVKKANADIDKELRADIDATVVAMKAISDAAEGGEAYDQQIGEGNATGNARVQTAIDALVKQTKSIERAVAALNLGTLEFEGSDSLDNPSAVFE